MLNDHIGRKFALIIMGCKEKTKGKNFPAHKDKERRFRQTLEKDGT